MPSWCGARHLAYATEVDCSISNVTRVRSACRSKNKRCFQRKKVYNRHGQLLRKGQLVPVAKYLNLVQEDLRAKAESVAVNVKGNKARAAKAKDAQQGACADILSNLDHESDSSACESEASETEGDERSAESDVDDLDTQLEVDDDAATAEQRRSSRKRQRRVQADV